ncbi:MAG: hypothetical protein PUF13_01560, partial [Lachnospiraceae bacterium]|nr:hypothetical protein [Lachnospiraceae bacterium]
GRRRFLTVFYSVKSIGYFDSCDAAELDRAGFIKKAFYVTIHLMKSTMLYNVVMLILLLFKGFKFGQTEEER